MNRLSLSLIVSLCGLLIYTVTWSQKFQDGTVDKEIRLHAYSGLEVLKYEVSWSGGIKIGDLHIEIQKDTNQDDLYSINARVKDSGLFHFFYPVNDTFVTVVSGENRLPVSYDVEQKEGRSYHALRHTEYDQQKGIVRYRKNKKAVETFQVQGEVHNEFSSFLYTRILELDKNKPVIVPTFADKKRHEVVVRTAKKATIQNDILGEVSVLPVSPIMTFKGLYDKSGDTVIYFTDDLCRVPVRINSKILIGSITAELVAYSSSKCLLYSAHPPETALQSSEKPSLKTGD